MATWATAAEHRSLAPSPQLPEARQSASPVVWGDVLLGLHLEFRAPDTGERFTAHPPFDVLREEANRVELRASTRPGVLRPRVTIVQTPDGLWAIARFADREFATRIE